MSRKKNVGMQFESMPYYVFYQKYSAWFVW